MFIRLFNKANPLVRLALSSKQDGSSTYGIDSFSFNAFFAPGYPLFVDSSTSKNLFDEEEEKLHVTTLSHLLFMNLFYISASPKLILSQPEPLVSRAELCGKCSGTPGVCAKCSGNKFFSTQKGNNACDECSGSGSCAACSPHKTGERDVIDLETSLIEKSMRKVIRNFLDFQMDFRIRCI
eukprot:TRINITY_DN1135_c0_g1_i2.p1 TRINITY_DN1135_c0_g1~~TRINITY_DN1135_c0_g1_i2.p1  ORF type:complete len:181 (-),score=30.30 TRINITY_DN1135_c0_g1_i2:163-705(-)